MNNEPLEEVYFKWLAAFVVNTRLKSPRLAYWKLLRHLLITEFVWFVKNDDNRIADGKELRSRFLEEHPEIRPTEDWLNQGCSFFEMLIALSARLDFQTESGSQADWFWKLLSNVNLVITDQEYEEYRMEMFACQVLDALNNRTYDPSGRGGLFPLMYPPTDQREVELWSQMNFYLIERS